MPMLALIGIAAVAVSGAAAASQGPAVPGSAPHPWPGAGTQDETVRALVSADDGPRLRAVLEIARADAATATVLLVPALRDRDPGVRLTAGRLLARRGVREATVAATSWLGQPGAHERLMGLLVLREAAELPEEARRAVERALRNGDVTTRLQGLELLAEHPAPSSFGAVVALLDDELTEVRARALRALAAMPDPRASLPVTRRLADSDRGVRLEAAATLGALGDRRVVPALLRQLDERSPDPRTWIVDALGRLGDAAALPALERLARRAPRDDLARHAALALGALGTPEAVEVLLALAREPPGSDDVRLALERAGAGAVPRLCREVSASSPTSARLAIEALGALGDRRATAALVGAVERGAEVSVAALEALARLADPAAVPVLVRVATGGGPPELRLLALGALEATGDARALVAVPRALAAADPGVRAQAAHLAGSFGGGPEVAALAASLADADATVRREAALALARLPVSTSAVAPAVLAALARNLDGAATLDALGDVLERAVVAADGPALGRAYVATASSASRAVLARGLAATFANVSVETPLEDGAVIAALLRDVREGGAPALSAADALGSARLARDAEPALWESFAGAEDAVRARLAPALARVPRGGAALARVLGDDAAAPSLRAAAAWALGADPDARAALEAAVAAKEPAVAANARAALARPARRRGRWTAVALASAAGEPLAGRWVAVSAGESQPVWVVTDVRGRARVADLDVDGGPLTLRLAPQ